MNRLGLVSLCLSILLYARAYSQPDSVRSASGADSTVPDTSHLLLPGQAMTTAPALAETAVLAVTTQGEVSDKSAGRQAGYGIYWLIGCGLFGIATGALGYRLLERSLQKKRPDETSGHLESGAEGMDDANHRPQEHTGLADMNNVLMLENEQLKRDKAGLEQLLTTMNHAPGIGNTDPEQDIIFYMPQPNLYGRFQEASRRTDAADSLYAFHVARDNQSIASFEFIAKDAYLNAAIGNEPSWISVACERTNQPTGTTTRVKTESPGLAILNNGEWEITRKARITYL